MIFRLQIAAASEINAVKMVSCALEREGYPVFVVDKNFTSGDWLFVSGYKLFVR